MIEAELPSGEILEFPDETAPDVIQATVKKVLASKQTKQPVFVPSGEKNIPSSVFDFSSPEIAAGNPLTRFAVGAGKPILGALQLGARVLKDNPVLDIGKRMGGVTGLVSNIFSQPEALDEAIKRYSDLKEAGRQQLGSEGIDWIEAAGTAVSPPFVAAAKALPVASTYAGKVGQGAGIGGVAGAASPVEDPEHFWTTKTAQTGGGAVIGAAVPAAAPVFKGAYRSLIEPWADPAAIKGRTYLHAAGDKADEIIERLRRNEQIVPGSRPTSGQAATPAGRAEFSALQKEASEIVPSQYLARADEQNAARLAALRTVGKDKAALQAAENLRSSTARVNYEKANATKLLTVPQKRDDALSISQFVAREGGLNKALVGGDLNTDYSELPQGLLAKGLAVRKVQHSGPTAKSPDHMLARLKEEGYLSQNNTLDDMYNMLADELAEGRKLIMSVNDIDATLKARAAAKIPGNQTLIELNKRPAFQQAVARAKLLAEEEGVDIGDPTNSIKGLHYVKLGLDDIISKAQSQESGIGNTQLRLIAATKDKLLGMMDEISPAYKLARQKFAEQSRPINQMQVAQYLENKLTPALNESGKQRANVFAQAVRDAPGTIKRSTTGQSRFDDLAQVLTPEQQSAVYSIRDDLANVMRDEQMARLGAKAAPNLRKPTDAETLPNLLSRTAMLTNAIIRRLEGMADAKLSAEIAAEMLNPPVVGESLAQAVKREARNKIIAKAVQQSNLITVPTLIQSNGNTRRGQ